MEPKASRARFLPTSFLPARKEMSGFIDEPRRDCRRLHSLRGWGHGTSGDPLDRREDRLHAGDVAQLGKAGERDAGMRPGLTTDERARLKQLERENFELRRAN